MSTVRCLWCERAGAPAVARELALDELPARPVLVRVAWSAVNYKDALAVSARAPIVRRFPLVPGIDLAGTVAASDDGRWRPGDAVFATGHGLGEDHWGGLATHARCAPGWLQPVPAGRDARWCMALGTAGLTAMQGVLRLVDHGLRPDDGPLAVTGASGGVGAVAVRALARLGYEVVAVSGKPDAAGALHRLGARTVAPREALTAEPGRALAHAAYAGGIDAAGGALLAGLLRRTRRDGAVAACGVAAGADLSLSVHPFILRGVTLYGLSSVHAPAALRERAWRLLDELVDGEDLELHEVGLGGVLDTAEALLAGRHRGRTLVRM